MTTKHGRRDYQYWSNKDVVTVKVPRYIREAVTAWAHDYDAYLAALRMVEQEESEQ